MTQRAIDGNYIYFVTANVQDRRWFFASSERAAKLGQAIQTCCRLKHFHLLAYCILPNHIHVLVRKTEAKEVPEGTGLAQRTLESMRCEETAAFSPATTTDASAFLFPQRTLERARCERAGRHADNAFPSSQFLFPHRRLSSRRCGPSQRYTLSDLMKSIKGTFSRTLAKGKFWQHRSNFRIVEDESYFANVIEYIRFNYTKMNLPERYGEAPFVFIDQSAIDRVFNE